MHVESTVAAESKLRVESVALEVEPSATLVAVD